MLARCAANRRTTDPDPNGPPNYRKCTRIHDLVAASSQLLQFQFQPIGNHSFDELDIPAPTR